MFASCWLFRNYHFSFYHSFLIFIFITCFLLVMFNCMISITCFGLYDSLLFTLCVYFFEIYAPETYEMFVYKHTETIHYVTFLKIQTSPVNSSRILRIKNVKFSGNSRLYIFYISYSDVMLKRNKFLWILFR